MIFQNLYNPRNVHVERHKNRCTCEYNRWNIFASHVDTMASKLWEIISPKIIRRINFLCLCLPFRHSVPKSFTYERSVSNSIKPAPVLKSRREQFTDTAIKSDEIEALSKAILTLAVEIYATCPTERGVHANTRMYTAEEHLWPRVRARAPRCFRSDELHQNFIFTGKVAASFGIWKNIKERVAKKGVGYGGFKFTGSGIWRELTTRILKNRRWRSQALFEGIDDLQN